MMTEYIDDIRKIMYVCGDCAQPHADSVALVEKVTQQQIMELAMKAMDNARQRSMDSEVTITVEDIFFLMRRDKDKIKRLLYQIEFKALAKRTSTSQNTTMGSEALHGGEGGERSGLSSCVIESEFLIDMFGSDFYSSEDTAHIQLERMERHDSRTRGMESTKYLNYVNCRQVSFVKNLVRFRQWLNLESLMNHTLANDVIEILAYLAYDIVRELVELSLLVKHDMERRHGDIISSQYQLILPHSQTITSSHSLNNTTQQHISLSGISQETSSSSSSINEPLEVTRHSRSRKRKKVNISQPLEFRSSTSSDMTGAYDSIPDQSGMRSEQSQTELGTDKSGCGIQRCHIREALRRLSIPSGPLLPMATHCSRPTYTQKTLCIS